MNRKKVLISAFACNPFRGSEDAVGWGWLQSIARLHDVHVITAEFQRDPIERWQREHADAAGPEVRFHYVRRRSIHYRPTRAWRAIETSPLKPIMNLAYAQWMRDAARLAQELDDREDFDLVHLVTYVGFRFPGRYWRLGKPFVWGPIGGLENTPWRFLPALGLYGGCYYAVRNVINSVQKLVLPSPKAAFRHAHGGVIAATEGTRQEILRHYGVDGVVIAEVGLPGAVATRAPERAADEPLRMVWSGEHQAGKALSLLIDALADLPRERPWELVVLGDGRRTSAWRRRARRRGLEDRIRWTGWVPRDAALAEFRAAHVLVITSMKDLTSTVLVEALSLGLPVVCPDHCGFTTAVDETCALKVPVESPGPFVRQLRAHVQTLLEDEGLRRRLGAGALRRAEHFDFARKARQVDEVYRGVVGARPRNFEAVPARAAASAAGERTP